MNSPSKYRSELTIEDALQNFFERNNLGRDGGLNDTWVKIKLGKFYIPFPNTAARKKALMLHDVHHVLTGYSNSWKGEAEIGAWEVSSGCGSYTAAWIFDLGIFALGFFLFPKAVFNAFIRGRRTLNFYKDNYTYQQILLMPIAQGRGLLKLEEQNQSAATAAEIGAFFMWWLIAFVVSFLIFVAPVALLITYFVNR